MNIATQDETLSNHYSTHLSYLTWYEYLWVVVREQYFGFFKFAFAGMGVCWTLIEIYGFFFKDISSLLDSFWVFILSLLLSVFCASYNCRNLCTPI